MKNFLVILFSLLVFTSRQLPAAVDYFDWLTFDNPRYILLKNAAAQAGAKGWVVQRMQRNEPLPQASARILAADLADTSKLDPTTREELRKAFPSEVSQYLDDCTPLYQQTEEIKKRIDALGPRIDELLARKDKNNYGPLSTPQGVVEFSNFLTSSAVHGFVDHEGTFLQPQSYGATFSLDLNGVVNNMQYQVRVGAFEQASTSGMHFNAPAYTLPGPGASYPYVNSWGFGNSFSFDTGNSFISLNLDPSWFPALQAKAGFLSIVLDDLIFAPIPPRPMPYYNKADSISIDSIVYTNPLYGGIWGFYFQKGGAIGWWPFTNSQLFLSPSWAPDGKAGWPINGTGNATYLYTQQGSGLNVATGRFDIRGLDLFVIQDSDFWHSFCITNRDESMFSPYQPYYSDHDYSLGMTGQILGGGLLNAEWATANFYSQGPQPNPLTQQDINWQDQAYKLALSKAFSYGSVSLDYAHVGPYFIEGPRQGLWTHNLQSGQFMDTTVDDPRNPGQITWQMNSRDPSSLINNSDRVRLQASWITSWSTLGISGGYATEINPSGPWITTARFLNNDPAIPQNSMWAAWFDDPYSPQKPGASGGATANYNLVTAHQAIYNGKPMTGQYYYSNYGTSYPYPAVSVWNWDDLQQTTYNIYDETILLSQNGVGDPNLRKDSVKTLNTLRTSAKLDFQALFHSSLPALVQGYAEIRDTDESVHLAWLNSQDLLIQQVNELFATIGITDQINLLGYAGYETLFTNQSYFQLNTEDYTWGLGFDFLADKFLDKMVFNCRQKFIDHTDLNFPQRSFSGWMVYIGATVNYPQY